MGRKKILLAAGMAAALAASHAQAQTAPNPMAPQPAKALTMMGAAIPCTDIDRSLAFYTTGLGLTAGPRMEPGAVIEVPMIFPGGGPYLVLTKQKTDNGAAAVQGQPTRVILAVPDVKALAAKLSAAGYRLAHPINEEAKFHVTVGLVDDPDGNHVELVQRTP
jgi:predicted enzyme related to lactoylglutathione lyase